VKKSQLAVSELVKRVVFLEREMLQLRLEVEILKAQLAGEETA